MTLRMGTFRRFLTVGVVNTLIGITVIFAAKLFFSANDVVANAIGYTCGLASSFMLNSQWTFAYRGPQLPAGVKFLLASALAYAANIGTVLLTIHSFSLNGYIAQLSGMPVYTLTSYFASKYIVFRSSAPGEPR